MSGPTDASTLAGPGRLFDHYRPIPGAHDEMIEAGAPRPHWRRLVDALNALDPEELTHRREIARRIIREHGVTYNVYGDPLGMDRPWELDMLPLVIPAAEWRRLETALIQRARLLNAVLHDLYGGPQRTLRDGFIPPSLVYANPGFLRACRGIRAPRDLYLHLHAVDLARSPDGTWWALADRTQAPSGAGYALENRAVLSRSLPTEFHACQVQRLTRFFQEQQRSLRSLARHHRQPTVVLLTPGPHNETYFEHAFLARHLGFPLVEGADLTVRDRQVFLKTLDGLQAVDVILRRLDDGFCDPLELRGDSFLGVPGLVDATRAGHVTIANALGSGLVESPALLAFLPGLCRHLLHEELLLPSVATWWCGQGRELRYVQDHLADLVIKPAFSGLRYEPRFAGNLSEAGRKRLGEELLAQPHRYVGQERVPLACAPVLNGHQAEPRPVVLRAFIAATHDGFMVLPGGLTRVSLSAADPVVSMQSGGGSKDTWILGDGPANRTPSSPVILAEATEVPPAGVSIPSRIADNFFWLGRYAERLEHTARLLRCAVGRFADESAGDETPQLGALARALSILQLISLKTENRSPLAEFQQEILLLVYHPRRPDGLRDLLARIRLAASVVRDRFTGDTWRILNRLQFDARSRPGRLPVANALGLLHTLISNLGAFSGMEMENMTRGHGWRFLNLGRRLERGSNLVHLLAAALDPTVALEEVLEPALEAADSVMTYRRRYFSRIELRGAAELLLRDATNPRSLLFQLLSLKDHLARLPGDGTDPAPLELQTGLNAFIQRLAGADLDTLSRRGEQHAHHETLAGLCHDAGRELDLLSEALTHRYFNLTLPRVSG